MAGFIGGRIGYELLRRVAGSSPSHDVCDGGAYANRSKLEVIFGAGVWELFRGKVVVDFGCGEGHEVIDIARHGARLAIGVDIRTDLLEQARTTARNAGVGDRCLFTTDLADAADVVISLDSFEHYDDPAAVLRAMRRLLRPGGFALISFGPPWYHPRGGHLFSVFPWAHLIFTEPALIRWRSDFKTDGATRFSEVAGGLNQMTVRRFQTLLTESDFDVHHFETVPIRMLRRFYRPVFREFLTSIVRCTLVPRH